MTLLDISIVICSVSILLMGIFLLKAASGDEDKSKYGFAVTFWYFSAISICGIIIGAYK